MQALKVKDSPQGDLCLSLDKPEYPYGTLNIQSYGLGGKVIELGPKSSLNGLGSGPQRC